MILILDIGNSAVKGGLFDGPELVRTFRFASDPTASVPAYRHTLRHHLGADEVTRAGLVSVVPAVAARLAEATHLETLHRPLVVHAGLALPFAMGYRTPETLGADRIAAAAAGWARYESERAGRPLVVVDAGTAVTYEVVDAGGTYRGGAIGPGPDLLRRALARGTAQLPEVAPDLPSTPIGRSTTEALQAGLMLPFLDGVRGMLARLTDALEAEPFVVLTGGWGTWLAERTDRVARVEPHLVLHGVRLLLDLNP